MKVVLQALALLMTLALVTGAMAAGSTTSKAEPKKVRGRVTNMEKSGAKITLSTYSDGKEQEIVITTDDKTKVTVDGKDAKVKDIAVGMRVNAEVTDGLASSITARKAGDTGQSGCARPKDKLPRIG